MKLESFNEIEDYTPPLFKKDGFLAPLLNFPGTVLAGGAIRDTYLNENIKDYDIFFTSEAQSGDIFDVTSVDLCCEFLKVSGFELVAQTHYTKTYRKDMASLPGGDPSPSDVIEVQIIFRDFYLDRDDVAKRFDFTNVMFALDSKGLFIGETTIEDNDDRTVNLNNVTVPLDSLNRLKKYALLGFDVDDAYKSLLKKLSKIDADEAYGVEGTFYGR